MLAGAQRVYDRTELPVTLAARLGAAAARFLPGKFSLLGSVRH